MSWKRFDTFLIGKVTHPIKKPVERGLALNLGDIVIVKSQNMDWYYGYSLMDYISEASLGIFPCNYVRIIGKDEEVWPNTTKENDSFSDNFSSRMLNTIVVHTSYWLPEIKLLVNENRNDELNEGCSMINQILNLFVDIMDFSDSKEKLKKLYDRLWMYINKVNIIFNLDITIDRKILSVIKITNLPIVKLEKLYIENTSEYRPLSLELDDSNYVDLSMTNSEFKHLNDMTILVDNFEFFGCADELVLEWMITNIYEECNFEHFWLPILETRKGKPKWKDEKFMFKGIPYDVPKDGLFLVVYVYRIGHLLNDQNKQLTGKFRRPIAFGSYNFKKFKPNNEKITIHFHNLNETDFLKPTIEILRMKFSPQTSNRCVQIMIDITESFTTRSLGINESHILENIHLSNDIPIKSDRHCLYIKLRGAEFDRANKKAAKNVEAQLSIKDENGQKVDCIICKPAAMNPSNPNDSTEYISSVTYHSNSPKWNDLIKIDLNKINPDDCYIYIEFFHCTTKDKKGDERKYFACGFLQLHSFFECEVTEKSYVISTKKNFSVPKKVKRTTSDAANDPVKNVSKEVCNLSLILCSTKLSNKKEINEFLLSGNNPNLHFSDLSKYLKAIQTMSNEDFLKPNLRRNIMEMTKKYFLSNLSSDKENLSMELFITCHVLFDKYIKLRLKEELYGYLRGEFQFIEALLNGIKNVFKHIIKLNISPEILAVVMNSMEPVFMMLANYSDLVYHYQISEGIKEILRWEICFFDENYSYDSNSDIHKLILQSINTNVKHIRNLTSVDVLIEFLDCLFKSKDFLNERILQKEKLDFIDQLLKSGIHQDCLDILLVLFHPAILLCTKIMNLSNHLIYHATEIILGIFLEAKQLLLEERLDLFSNKIMKNMFSQVYLLYISKQNIELQKNRLISRRESEDPLANGNSITSKTTDYSPDSERLYTLLFSYLEEWYEISNADITVSEITSILGNTKNLLEVEVYPKNWLSMYLKISDVCVQILEKAAVYIGRTPSDVNVRLIQVFLDTCFTFIVQNCLNLEKSSFINRKKIINQYKDMRVTVTDCFLNVCRIKSSMIIGFDKSFILQMMNKVFRISLLPVVIIRLKIIPFFCHLIAHMLDKCNDKNEILKGLIPETEVIFREGHGDEAFYDLLCNFKKMDHIQQDVKEVVNVISKLMDLHLENRKLSKESPKVLHNQFILFAFMKFYKEDVDIPNLFLFYSNKFSQLLEADENTLEAALVLKLQFDAMPWNEETTPFDTIFFENFKGMNSEQEKVKLGIKIIDLLTETKEYEEAALICENFSKHYLSTYNYKELSPILKKMSEFYELIINESRLKMNYYRITFIGGALPSYMRFCRDYIFKCSIWFKVNNIKDMFKNDFPDAEVQFYQSTPPTESHYEHKMIIFIAKMDPIPFDTDLSKNRNIHTKIRDFYKDHTICSFSSDHPFHKGTVDKDNEVKTVNVMRYIVMTEMMPNVFMWNPIINEQMQTLTPLEVATDIVLKKNQTFKDTIDEYTENPGKDLKPFSMLLIGTLDAGVNGGMAKYIKAFFSDEATVEYDILQIKEFKEALLEQKNVLSEALELHKTLVTPPVIQLHERCEECFKYLSEIVGDLNVFKSRTFSTMPTFDNVYARLESISVKTSGFDTTSEKSYFFQEDIRISDALSVRFSDNNFRLSDDVCSSNSTLNIQKSFSGSDRSLLGDILDSNFRPRKISSADEEQLQRLAEKQALNLFGPRQSSMNPSCSTPEININRRIQSSEDDGDDEKASPVKSPPLPPENTIQPWKNKKLKKTRSFFQAFKKGRKDTEVVQNMQADNPKSSVDSKRRPNLGEIAKIKSVDTD